MSSGFSLTNSLGQEVEVTGDSIQGSSIGSVEMYATMTAPAGYLVCPPAEAPDSAYPLKTAFPDLYAKVGDIWGVLTDTTRFKIPNSSKDGKGYFSRGTGNVGVGTQQDDVFKEHEHEVKVNTYSRGTGSNAVLGSIDPDGTGAGSGLTRVSGDTTETRPMAQTMLMCIKAFHSVASVGDVNLQVIINDMQSKLPQTAIVDFGTVSKNTRTVIANPFGNANYEKCTVIAEIFANGIWSETGWQWYGTATSYGTRGFSNLEGIVVQTGLDKVVTASTSSGGGHGTTNQAVSAPCRVIVTYIPTGVAS